MHNYSFPCWTLFIALIILIGASCKKAEEPYLNYNRITDNIGILPRFDTRHQLLQLESHDYLLCGSTVDSIVFVARLDVNGNPINLNTSIGRGSAHDIISIPYLENRFLLLATHREENNIQSGFFTVVTDSSGASVAPPVYYGQEFDAIGLREYAEAYAVVPTRDSGFFFTGGFKQTLSSQPSLFGLMVDAELKVKWLKTYRANAYGASAFQMEDGPIIVSAITDPYAYLIAIDENNGRKLAERTFFQTSSQQNDEAILSSDGTIALATTSMAENTASINFIECTYDRASSSFEVLHDLSLGDKNANEYGHQIIQGRDGGFVILGTDDQEPASLVLQYISVSRSQGWRERYQGGTIEQPGDIVQSLLDFGYFCFGISEDQDGKSSFHFIKTDEVGRTEESLE
ncbi:hypothetical protein [Phaeodactylibacter xiamenensis]|jgi:hypothetical protein|uniref:hypothetical protein n=1 Tax=Phaeodactylibacter xiamenensis TaxID=1524460 RepID=UPI0024A951A9|nr:hypothetical protein [Phaeodactylibacter xiamenensis]